MTMFKAIGRAATAALVTLALPAMASENDDFEYAPLVPGEGAEEVYFNCIACHSLLTVTAQRLSRERWDQLLDWMTDTHGMHVIEGAEREIILDYLKAHYGPD